MSLDDGYSAVALGWRSASLRHSWRRTEEPLSGRLFSDSRDPSHGHEVTDTSRRSAARAPVETPAAPGAATTLSASGAPHLPQDLSSASTGLPHEGQATLNALPHGRQ
jgi:hypothetical protein